MRAVELALRAGAEYRAPMAGSPPRSWKEMPDFRELRGSGAGGLQDVTELPPLLACCCWWRHCLQSRTTRERWLLTRHQALKAAPVPAAAQK
ncbi:hypothetical protein UY3_15432 [Chelonia mydas]|uniref:Uncharacterized protein n=1 Tax=Chelonia mydas TaxID=8469 RepID=M7BGV3_CHEMY|nr:hypothetical protein UY3_15432 [Chelonia mydas]